jgi:putative membrane protein
MLRWALAATHLIALGIGLGAVWARSRALADSVDAAGLRRVFAADTWWGVAAFLWIGTGLLRAFAGFEKGAAYYLHNRLFWIKMGLLAVILVLELRPMVLLIRWRQRLARGEPVDAGPAPGLAAVSAAQAVIVLLMVLAATAMARGFGTF